jgi:hypothetical protein
MSDRQEQRAKLYQVAKDWREATERFIAVAEECGFEVPMECYWTVQNLKRVEQAYITVSPVQEAAEEVMRVADKIINGSV